MQYTLDITESMIRDAHKYARDAMHATDFIEFRNALLNLNQTVRGYSDKSEVKFRNKEEAVYHDNGSTLWVAPSADAVEPLLQKAWKKSLTFDSEPKRARFLIHSINAIHPFQNGNGRSGRALYYYPNSEEVNFRKAVWPEAGHAFSSIHNNLIDEALRADLADITHRPNAKSLILRNCAFEDPYYWKDRPWTKGMPKEYQMLLEEKNGDSFRLRHEAVSLRFPHITLLDFAIKRGIIKAEDLDIDENGTVRVDIHPEKFIGMSTHGAEVMRELKEKKNRFTQSFLQDERGILNEALNSVPRSDSMEYLKAEKVNSSDALYRTSR